MIILTLVIITISFILIRIILQLIIKKFGKISYDGFSAAGFQYNSEKDIFYSTRSAWQKNFGYTHLYDVAAPIFRMIIDTESIRFYYNKKNWLISFWKGQYGMVTGAEVGIYNTYQQKVNKKTVYFPVSDNEMPNIYIILYKNGKEITKANAKHWWLAVFKLGMFSNPKELTVSINITFKNKEMLEAFLESFEKLGYKQKDYKVIDNTFCFNFVKPRTRKVWTRSWLTDKIRQNFNRKNVELYNSYLGNFIDDNNIDDSKIINNNLIMVNDLIPDLLKNKKDNQNDKKQIINKIYNKDENNVILLNSNIYSKYRVDKNE